MAKIPKFYLRRLSSYCMTKFLHIVYCFLLFFFLFLFFVFVLFLFLFFFLGGGGCFVLFFCCCFFFVSIAPVITELCPFFNFDFRCNKKSLSQNTTYNIFTKQHLLKSRANKARKQQTCYGAETGHCVRTTLVLRDVSAVYL